MLKKTNYKSILSIVLTLILVFVTVSASFPAVTAMAESGTILYSKPIGDGISFVQKQQYNDSGKKQRLNVVTADLNNSGTKVVLSKAKDEVKKFDTLSQQIQREIYKGNNIIAGINADMFDMSNGFSTGPQVVNGAILTAHLWRSEEKIYPVFGITKDNKAFIDNIYLDAKLTAGDGSSISIDNLNRENYKDSLIINTPQLNNEGKIDFSSYASNGALTIVSGISGPIKLGNTYEGTVESIGLNSKSAVIGENTVVIASNGSKADWISSHLSAGDKISFKFNYSRNDIKDVLGVYTYVVKDAKPLTSSEMIRNGASSAHVTSRSSRTAIGITADNKVVALAVDNGTSYSEGMTYEEMGKAMLNLGAVSAAVLDGGGSTQMNVRLFGNNFIDVVNNPSDGKERSITNAILFADSGQRTYEAGSIDVDKDITIFKNTSYTFKAKGTDTNYNPIDFSFIPVSWKCDKGIGNIASNGAFTSGPSKAQGSITASLGGVNGTAAVKVVDSVNSLSIYSSSSISILAGKPRQFNLSATDAAGTGIIITNKAAKWSVSGKIGKISENGLFTPTVKSGKGVITAQIGSIKATVNVTVYQAPAVKDTKAPILSSFSPSGTVYSQNVQIGVTLKDDSSGINKKSISTKLDGKAVTSSYNTSTGRITYSAKNLSSGTHTFLVSAADNSGNKVSSFKGTFTVNTNKDVDAPVINTLTPIDNFEIKITTPRISFNVKDVQSGVEVKGISVSLDGKSIPVTYDPSSGWAYALPAAPLSKGKHTVVVNARDKAGNSSEAETTEFTVNPLTGPINNDKFSFSVATDTHATGYANEIFRRINQDNSELIIENGDVVDTSNGWQTAMEQLKTINSKPVMAVPGNHEAADGNLNSFLNNFGMSTYHFDFGNSLFVVLNSSSNQSISASDPTQFTYLQNVLSKNSKENIFIFTHVPVRDSIGIDHQMNSGDVAKLQKILGDYKKANPKKNINVVFGHLHTIQNWSANGIIYTIAGNGCLKKYVDPQNGGFLSYTKFSINGSTVARSVIPIVNSIAITDSGKYDGNQMDIPNGSKRTLKVSGDFKLLSADYIVELSKFKDMPINWSSDNPSVASVAYDGTVTALQNGTAQISASIGDKVCSIVINVVGQENIKPLSLKPVALTLVSKQNAKPQLIAMDLYGNTYTLNNLLVDFKVASTLGTIGNGAFTAADTKGKDMNGEITAAYEGLTVKIPVKITKAVTAKKYVIVTGKTLNMRSTPSTGGSIVTTLKSGDKLEVISDTNGWLKVSFNGKTGYVLKSYTKGI